MYHDQPRYLQTKYPYHAAILRRYNEVAKKKIWEKVQPGLVTTDGKLRTLNPKP
jgi:hypothetical protein